jgi:hypothetical protein
MKKSSQITSIFNPPFGSQTRKMEPGPGSH